MLQKLRKASTIRLKGNLYKSGDWKHKERNLLGYNARARTTLPAAQLGALRADNRRFP